MTDAAHSTRRAASPRVDAALRQLATRGSVTLPGAQSRASRRWERQWLTAVLVYAGAGVLGIVAIVVGIFLRDVGAWGLLAVVGGMVAFLGLTSGTLMLALHPVYRRHVGPELEPVTLSPAGITLRGVGPIPWTDVFPPEVRRVRTRQPIGGILPVMLLTDAGRARATASPRPLVIGPQPYLRYGIHYLRLPGIAEFSEEDTVELFGRARAMFVRS